MLAGQVATQAPIPAATNIYLRHDAGVIAVTDADRVDFLQRITSNNVARLKPGDATVTILTSPVAKIVHVFTVLARVDALWLLPAPGESAALARHLRGQIFFLDKVKVQEIGVDWRSMRVFGENAVASLRQVGIEAAARDDSWVESDSVIAVTQQRYDLPGVELIVQADALDSLLARLGESGAAPVIEETTYAGARIAARRPAAGAELTSDYSPLEVGMDWACADDKGCYTGQEIIARQRTYDKVTRTLVALTSDTVLQTGAALVADGREVGKVTSAAIDPATGRPVALGVVKRPHNTSGSRLLAGEIPVAVVEIAEI